MDAEKYLADHLRKRQETHRSGAEASAPAQASEQPPAESKPAPTADELADTWETLAGVSALLSDIIILPTDLKLMQREGLFGQGRRPVASGRTVLSNYQPGVSAQFDSDASHMPGTTYARQIRVASGTPPSAKGIFMNYNGWLSQYHISPAGQEISPEGITTIIIPKKPLTEVQSFYEEHGRPPVYEPQLVLDGLAAIAEAHLDVTPKGLLVPRGEPLPPV
jgi:hypothetical protein